MTSPDATLTAEAPNRHPRHPELVSGSILPSMQISQFERWMLKQVQHDENSGLGDRLKPQANSEIMPVRVFALDEVDLPLAVPTFQLLFSRNGRVHGVQHLISDETMDAVTLGETGQLAITMLPKSRGEIARDADIKCAVRFACENVDTRVSLQRHSTERDGRWILKQVQDDGFRRQHNGMDESS